MTIRYILPIAALLLALLLAGCQPIQPAADAEMPAEAAAEAPANLLDDAAPAAIVLPDGTECLWAGGGATLAFDGNRVNYTCGAAADGSGEVVLLGDPVAGEETVWTVTRGVVARQNDAFVLASSAEESFFLAQLDLADESTCLHAGFGATFGVEMQRVNWTCGDAEPLHVVAGPLTAIGEGVFTAFKAQVSQTADGFTTDSTETVPVVRVTGDELPE